MNREILDSITQVPEYATAAELLHCSNLPTTSGNLRRAILLLLRSFFASPDNYGAGYDHLKCLYWAPDDAGTLTINYAGTYDDSRPEAYPAIIVGEGRTVIQNSVIANTAEVSDDMSRVTLACPTMLTLPIRVIEHQPSTNATDVADLIARMLTAIGPPLLQRAGASGITVSDYGEPTKETQAPDRYYAVAITVAISYTMNVSRNIEAPRLRTILNHITNG